MKITDNAGYRNLRVIRILSYGETQQVAARLAEYSERFEIKKVRIRIVYSVWQPCMLDSHKYNKEQIQIRH